MYKGYLSTPYQSTHVGGNEQIPIAAPATLLGLPVLSPAIPLGTNPQHDPSTIEFIRTLAKADIITQDDRQSTDSLSTILKRVLEREINQATGELTTFKLDFSIMTADSLTYSEFDYGLKESTPQIGITIENQGYAATINISAVIDALESIMPHLGQTAYALIESCGRGPLSLRTFKLIREDFSHELGLDFDDDEREEYGGMFSSNDIKTMAKDFKYSWVNSAKRKIPKRTIKSIINDEQVDLRTRTLLNAVCEASTLCNQKSKLLSSDHESINYSECILVPCLGYLEFFSDDPSTLLMNEVCEAANQCSDTYSQSLFAELYDLTHPEVFLRCWKHVIHTCQCIRALDRVATALAAFKDITNVEH